MNLDLSTAIYALQIAILQGFAAPRASQMAFHQALRKNPKWVRSHPSPHSLAAHIAVHRLLAGVLLLAIGGAWWMQSSAHVYQIHMASFLFFFAQTGFDALRFTRLERAIPPDTVRRADLQGRVLEAHIPRSVLVLAGALHVCAAGGWVLLLGEGIVEVGLAVRVLMLLAAGPLALWWSIRRRSLRSIPADRGLAARFRRYEVAVSAACALGLVGLSIALGAAEWVGADQNLAPIVDYVATIGAVSVIAWFASTPQLASLRG